MASAKKIGAANSAPRLQFCGCGFFLHLVAGGAVLTGAVADLARSAPTFRSNHHEQSQHHN
jgi:hypothetical protein